MPLPSAALLLRVYLGEAERHGSAPLYETLILKAKSLGLAGATVLRGPMGFGHSRELRSAKILDLSSNLPLVIEIVEVREKIVLFLDAVRPMLTSTLVTLEDVRVLQYGPDIHEIDIR